MKRYKISYLQNGLVKSKIISKQELENSKEYKNIISIKEQKNVNLFRKSIKIDNKRLKDIFYELNLMLQSNINIGDALDILIKNCKNKNELLFLQKVSYSLANSKPIDIELENFKIDKSVKVLLKISQNSANISHNIRTIYILLKEAEELKKTLYKAISYPLFLAFSLIIAILAIFLFVLPNFKSIFEQSNNLPIATKILLHIDMFFIQYLIIIGSCLGIVLILFFYFYKKNKKFLFIIDKALVKYLPIISNMNLTLQLYKLFLVLDIMQKAHFEFHKSFQFSTLLLENKYLLDRIYRIDSLLENGKTIKESFGNSLIFDDIVLNLLNTAEVSNSLDIVVEEIKKIYKNRFDDSVNFLIRLIQPIFLIFMALLILFIVVAIFTPIWDLGSMIK